MKSCIAIPTRFAINPLRRLVPKLLDDPEVDRVLILDNGHPSNNARMWFKALNRDQPKIEVVNARGWSIHRMWNFGWEYAREHGYEFYGAFNDDIIAPHGLVGHLAAAMRDDTSLWIVSPEWTRRLNLGVDVTGDVRRVNGTQRHGGLAGWCWLLRTDIPVPPIDEQFEWWYGDDDLAEQIRLAGGGLGVVVGLPLEHKQETTARRFPWTREAIERDGVRYDAKYGVGSALPTPPKISVLVPTMNRTDRLRVAVSRMLAQDYPSFEIIVQNGGEPFRFDGDDDPLADDRVITRTAPDKGICNALNKAAELATGDIWHVACDDDEMLSGTFRSAQVAFNTGARWSYGWMRYYQEFSNGQRKQVYRHTERLWPWDLAAHQRGNAIAQPTVFFARDTYEMHGPFNEDFPMCWDYEWWMRLGVRYDPVPRDHCDAHYIIWPGSTSVHSVELMNLEVERMQQLWARVGYGER